MSERGMLYVISAPSGCGKGTILSQVFNQPDKVFYSVSLTTRAPRENEVDGVHYHFVTKEQFEQMNANGDVLESAEYCGNFYGTPRIPVEENLAAGKDVVLEIETKGADQVRAMMPEAVFIFILPPSVAELRRRLLKRGTENATQVEMRVAQAVEEIKNAGKYDYILVNDELEKAVDDFKTVIRAARLEKRKNIDLIDEVLKDA